MSSLLMLNFFNITKTLTRRYKQPSKCYRQELYGCNEDRAQLTEVIQVEVKNRWETSAPYVV